MDWNAVIGVAAGLGVLGGIASWARNGWGKRQRDVRESQRREDFAWGWTDPSGEKHPGVFEIVPKMAEDLRKHIANREIHGGR